MPPPLLVHCTILYSYTTTTLSLPCMALLPSRARAVSSVSLHPVSTTYSVSIYLSTAALRTLHNLLTHSVHTLSIHTVVPSPPCSCDDVCDAMLRCCPAQPPTATPIRHPPLYSLISRLCLSDPLSPYALCALRSARVYSTVRPTSYQVLYEYSLPPCLSLSLLPCCPATAAAAFLAFASTPHQAGAKLNCIFQSCR